MHPSTCHRAPPQSGQTPTILPVFTNCSKKSDDNSNSPTPLTVTDSDGNVYQTIKIGTQVWTTENLKTTKYNDGTAIPFVTGSTEWSNLTTDGYCWHSNIAAGKNAYGALYNWFTVSTGKLAPRGWHIPSDAEWTVLTDFLGGESVAGGKMKSTGNIEAGTGLWYLPNEGATNETGLSIVAGGFRGPTGEFWNIGFSGDLWSSTESIASASWYRYPVSSGGNINRNYYNKTGGMSVRCIRYF